MNKLLFIFLLSCLSLFSCKNEEKEKYLSQVNATLDREIDWVYERIENRHKGIQILYLQEGKNSTFTPFASNATTIYNNAIKLRTIDSTENDKGNSDLISRIEQKNKILQESVVAYDTLFKIWERIKGINFEYNQINKIIIIPQNTHLTKNEALQAEIQLGTIPMNFHPDWKYQTFIHNIPAAHINGIVEFYLSGDSTQKMTPGKHQWDGNIEMTVKGKDSSFNFTETFFVVPACK